MVAEWREEAISPSDSFFDFSGWTQPIIVSFCHQAFIYLCFAVFQL